MNIASLYTRNRKDKLLQLAEIAKQENVAIIAVVESHLREKQLTGEVRIRGFRLHRLDQANGVKKGGVALYLREDIAGFYGEVQGASVNNTEFMSVYNYKDNTVLSLVYRPEGIGGFSEALYQTRRFIERWSPPLPNIIMLGDFNFPRMDWQAEDVRGAGNSTTEREAAQMLCNFMSDHCLTQLIDEATREQNILDLLLTNNNDLVYDFEVRDSGLSDHRMIMITLLMSEGSPRPTVERRDLFSRYNFFSESADWQKLEDDLMQVQWPDAPTDLDEYYDYFLRELSESCERNVPLKKPRSTHFIPRDRRVYMRKRRKLEKKARVATGREAEVLLSRIRDINEKLKHSVTAELERDEDRAVAVVKSNPKYFYAYARSRGTCKSGIGPLMSNGELVGDPAQMADLLQENYKAAYSDPFFPRPMDVIAGWAGPDLRGVFDCVTINEQNILGALCRLSPRSAPGPDGVPAVVLKRCSRALLSPLLTLWRSSMETGYVPRKLKEGIVTPIYKGGNKGDSGNYRPVTLTSHVSKTIERVIADNLVEHLEKGGLLSPNQHGFRKGRSCYSQLMQHHYTVLRMLESGAEVDIAYLDFSKAFDKVDLGILLVKLRAIGVRGPVLRWMQAFLLNRWQKVIVEGKSSTWGEVISGVPQGTVLGPILFLAHIADIDVGISSRVSCFADDTRVVRAIRDIADCGILQGDLDEIYRWAENNNMKFNGDKFRVLHYEIGTRTTGHRIYYTPEGTEIETTSDIKDLGVQMSNDAKFTLHISTSIKKARRMMGWVLRTFSTREPEPLLILYKALVMPHLEYCCQLWSPVVIGEIRKLESVQRSFTARIAGLRDLDYW